MALDLEILLDHIVSSGFSMLPREVIAHFGDCIQTVEAENIPGDIIETGIWRGGACIYAYHTLRNLGSNRTLFACDSFQGLPKPNTERFPDDEGDPHWKLPLFIVSEDQVKKNFERFAPIDPKTLRLVPGWFCDTLPDLDIDPIAVMRLDGDMYESTFIALQSLYPKLSPGGFCIIDDFGHARARKAALDYRALHSITEPIMPIEHPGPYPHSFWRKSKPYSP